MLVSIWLGYMVVRSREASCELDWLTLFACIAKGGLAFSISLDVEFGIGTRL